MGGLRGVEPFCRRSHKSMWPSRSIHDRVGKKDIGESQRENVLHTGYRSRDDAVPPIATASVSISIVIPCSKKTEKHFFESFNENQPLFFLLKEERSFSLIQLRTGLI